MNPYEYEAYEAIQARRAAAIVTLLGVLLCGLVLVLCIWNFRIPDITIKGIDHGSGEAFTATIGVE